MRCIAQCKMEHSVRKGRLWWLGNDLGWSLLALFQELFMSCILSTMIHHSHLDYVGVIKGFIIKVISERKAMSHRV